MDRVIAHKITQTVTFFFSPSGGVDIESNTFLFDRPLYECVLHNYLE